jgi:hypothetical protein
LFGYRFFIHHLSLLLDSTIRQILSMFGYQPEGLFFSRLPCAVPCHSFSEGW